MSITFRCACGKQSELPESTLGKRVRCNFCGALSIVAEQPPEDHPELDWETHIAESLLTAPTPRAGPRARPGSSRPSRPSRPPRSSTRSPRARWRRSTPGSRGGRRGRARRGPAVEDPKEYKVLSQRDKWFGGKFDAERLEEALNFLAGQGWAVRSMAAGAIGGFAGEPRGAGRPARTGLTARGGPRRGRCGESAREGRGPSPACARTRALRSCIPLVRAGPRLLRGPLWQDGHLSRADPSRAVTAREPHHARRLEARPRPDRPGPVDPGREGRRAGRRPGRW